MRYYFPLLLLLLLVACKNEPTNQAPATPPPPPPAKAAPAQTPAPTKSSTGEDGPVHIKASNVAFLVGLWEYTFALGAENETPKYKGRWIEFKNDDTFISGRYGEETNQGTYQYEDDPKRILTLTYAKKEEIPGQWEIQGQGHNGMVFKGNTPLNPSGLQVRMQQVNQRPKQQ
ncbi:MAG: hypothetical protein AAF985_06970 [Bacteroidota bacterium]